MRKTASRSRRAACREVVPVTPSSGNVFADLGLRDADELLAKAGTNALRLKVTADLGDLVVAFVGAVDRPTPAGVVCCLKGAAVLTAPCCN